MPAILAAVLEVFALLSNVASTIGTILGIVGGTAQEHAKYAIEKIAANAANTVNSPTWGNQALLAAIADAKAQGIADTAAILVAITDLTDGTTPVQLPPDMPAGWVEIMSAANAADVWTGYVGVDTERPWDYLKSLGSRSLFMDGYANIFNTDGMFNFFFPNYGQHGELSSGQPVFHWDSIDPTKDFVWNLQNQNGDYTVAWYDGAGGIVLLNGPIIGTAKNFTTIMTGSQFEAYKNAMYPNANRLASPVWPGADRVILGTPVDIASQLTVTEPMDGVIVTITGVTVNKPALAYDTELAYKFIGGIAFVDDNGEVEPFQTLAFTHALYSPSKMVRAVAVVVRADASVVGTITPWVIA